MPSIRDHLHEDIQRGGDEPEQASPNRSFGLVLGGFFALLALSAGHAGRPSALWLFGVAVILAAIALRAPGVLAWPNWVWQKLGYGLHLIVSPVILAVMFFGVITPMAALMRLAGHDPMRRRRDPAATSYWIVRRPPGPAPDSMRHQF
jgi:hypothetical protein